MDQVIYVYIYIHIYTYIVWLRMPYIEHIFNEGLLNIRQDNLFLQP